MQRSRTPSNLSKSLHHRLNAYALAASAAGVGMLALIPPAECVLSAGAALAGAFVLSEPAEAKIVYTKTNVVMACTLWSEGCRGYFSFDLNHDRQPDVGFTIREGCITCEGELVAKPAGGNGIEVGANHSHSYPPWAAALKAGESIGHAKPFNTCPSDCVMRWSSSGHTSGYWNYAQARYLGVVFLIKGKPHYGWMRIKNSSDTGGTVTGYAYETIPGKAIKAGRTHGKDVITVEPATLGHLARGASAIPAWRGTN
jgi:hypothetical protein